MSELMRLKGVLADAPVLPLSRFDARRRELVLGVESGNKGALSSVVGRAFPDYDLVVLAADDARDLLCELSRPEYEGPLGGVRLADPGRVCWRFRSGIADMAIEVFGHGYESAVYFDRFPRVDRFGNAHRGGVWWGTEDRLDGRGVEWSRRFTDLVTDDFGTLVDSSTGEAP